MLTCTRMRCIDLLLLGHAVIAADFWYTDFNDTTGLRFNGEATTSTCDDGVAYAYNLPHGRNDRPTTDEIPNVISESTQMLYSVTNTTTSTYADTVSISESYASHAHRQEVHYDIRTGCPGRMRYGIYATPALCILQQ
jgi:hypothetical protein